jgi:hypothetical protein
MMDSEDLIREYWDSIKEKYPELSYEEVKEICHSPFVFLKDMMQREDLPEVRMKYLGVFRVYLNRAKYILDQLEQRKTSGSVGQRMSDQRRERFRVSVEKFIIKTENDEKGGDTGQHPGLPAGEPEV